MSSNVSRPEIKSVMCTSFTSKPAKYIALAISRSELLPFSRIIAAFGLSLSLLMTGSFPVKFFGNSYFSGCFLKLLNLCSAKPFEVCF